MKMPRLITAILSIRIYRMRVLWVRPPRSKPYPGKQEFEHNVWILKLWGNPRNIAIKKAEITRFYPRHWSCVSAWYNPVEWRPKSFGV